MKLFLIGTITGIMKIKNQKIIKTNLLLKDIIHKTHL